MINLDDVNAGTTWLIPGRIPLDALTLFVGAPGIGKTTYLMELAASVSAHSTVLIMKSFDDPMEHRSALLKSFGADMSVIYEGGGEPAHLIEAIPNVRLLIADPVTSLIPDVDLNDPFAVSTALSKVIALAKERRFAIVGTSPFHDHLYDDPSHIVDPSYTPFFSLASMVWVMKENPTLVESRHVWLLKSTTEVMFPQSYSLRMVLGRVGEELEPDRNGGDL